MTKHTPGPWGGEQRHPEWPDVTVAYVTAASPNGYNIEVAALFGGSDPNERLEVEANARLMAAAPELLEALKYALPMVEKWTHTQGDIATWRESVLAPIRAAIAKAEVVPPSSEKEG